MIKTNKTSISWLMPLSPQEKPELLAMTLKCLEKQTLKANELVIAIDGPISSSLKQIINQSNLPIKVLKSKRNEGIGKILKKAAPTCKGEFLVRVDSDDIYSPEHTFKVTEALKKMPYVGVLGTQLLELDNDNNFKITARKTPIARNSIEKWLPWRNPLNHQTVVIRKKALLKAGGYRNMPGFEDWDLWLRINSSGFQIANLSIYTVAARVNKSHRLRRKGIKYSKKEFEFYFKQYKEGRINIIIIVMAFIIRIPFRLTPKFILDWWMQSNLRGSPPLDTPWVTKPFKDESRQQSSRNN